MSLRDSIGWESHLKPFLYKRLPDKTGWSAVLGTLSALTFGLLAATGMVLAFYYVPSPDKAYNSVRYISQEVPMGGVLRGLHHWGAGLMVLLVFLHLLTAYLHGAYMKPRRLTWISGVALFLVVLGLGFTGYLLPWDMKAYWATVVGANIPSQYPLVGDGITRSILGGDGMSGFTLTRFYSVHTLALPACLLLLAALHIYLIRVHNLSDPEERFAGDALADPATRPERPPYRFFPEHLTRTSLAFGAVFILLLIVAVNIPAPLEEKAGTIIADYLPRPEWYYMWLFQLLTYFSGKWEIVGSLLLPLGGVGLLFAVPFLSESRMKGMVNRPVSLTIAITCVVCVVYLTVRAYADAAPYNKVVLLPKAALSPQAKAGLSLYVERNCAYCHNILGVGGHRTGPDLSNMTRKKRSPEYLAEYIKDPVSKFGSSTMPSYNLTPQELKDLSAFILSLRFPRSGEAVAVATETVPKPEKKVEQTVE